MANSTTIIADFKTVLTNGPSATTKSNALTASGLSATGGAGNMTGGSGIYAAGTYYGGIMDYTGNVQLCLLKAQEMAVLLAKVLVNTDASSDSANQALLVAILNDLQ
jgi:hypothetical protein